MIVIEVVGMEVTIMVVCALVAGILTLSRASGQPRKRSLGSKNTLRVYRSR
jgi:hypothetical protein